MAFATYSDLKTAIQAFYKNRADVMLYAPDLIRLTEAYLNTELRCREMETTVTLTPVSNIVTLPDDFLEFKRVVENASIRRPLSYITEDDADSMYATRSAGLASNFTIVGNQLQAFPLSSNTIEIVYYRTIPALSDSNPTNWLLTKFPNIYLHGALMYGAELTKDNEEMLKEATLLDKYIGNLQGLDNRSKFGNVGVTLSGYTP